MLGKNSLTFYLFNGEQYIILTTKGKNKMFNKDYYWKTYDDFYLNANRRIIEEDYNKPDIRWLLPYLPKDKNGTILDIGCGAGLLLNWLWLEGYTNLTGIDISPKMVALSRLKLNPKVAIFEGDAFGEDGLLFRFPHYYNQILMFDVIEHIEKSKLTEVVKALDYALVDEGSVIIRTANADCVLSGACRYIDMTHELIFTWQSLRQLMFAGGFKHYEVINLNACERWWVKALLKGRDAGYYLIYRLHKMMIPPTFDTQLLMRFWR